ncbi:phosphotransferase family protein [Desertimonas flava]|uniref:phosphotransferase family protein n=2 Tax=Desertimonas flava TaxID=2064846 RepID=UPI0023F24463|nr:phosphotransferase family protein [Desertimonas flava]
MPDASEVAPAAPVDVPVDVPVDMDRLAAWMDERGLGSGPLTHIELLAGGTQNVLVRFTRDGRSYVLRHPPIHKRDNSDETMRREARVLAALAGSEVPHPGLIAAEPGLDVLGSAFYLMEPIEGVNVTVEMPEPLASSAELQRSMGLSMPAAIAALGTVDPVAAGLADLGRSEGWLERQVPRWRKQLDSYAQFEGYGGPDIPGVDQVAAWLEAHRPTEMRIGIIHGDFHFANVLIDPVAGVVSAVVDWELATIGHPLLDLGHLLATWPGASAVNVTPVGSSYLPSTDEVIARYGELTGWDLADLPWFRVLACYRLGIILEGSNARADAGLAPREIGDRLHEHTVGLFEQALRLVGD